MRKPLISTVAAALFGAAALAGISAAPASAAATSGSGEASAPTSASASAHKKPTFEGTVALSNCSGSVVKLKNSKDSDPALVLSNGHCLQEGMPGAGEVIVDKKTSRDFTLLNADGATPGRSTPTRSPTRR
ncbi:hypothetical protein [Streptomyces axinellae]|uniref:Serine protease n=1 Tax=Streptomyces axinellae TaxID=552788 RepID=A0ABN3QK08_9ACTN